MKLKEKKIENPIEETIEVDDKLLEYLKFSRECEYQFSIFAKIAGITVDTKEIDDLYKELGIDTCKPVQIVDGFCEENLADDFKEFIQEWIDAFNDLDLNSIDNYTRFALFDRIPSYHQRELMKRRFKKCE